MGIDLSDAEIENRISRCVNAFDFWRGILREYGIDTGAVIMTDLHPDVNDMVMDMLPYLKTEKKHRDIVIVSDSEEVLNHSRSRLSDRVYYKRCPGDMILDYCHMQALTFWFRDIYVTQTEYIDDADSFRLAGSCDCDLWFVVAKVVLGLSSVPKREAIKATIDHHTLDWSKYSRYIAIDYSQTESREEFLRTRVQDLIDKRIIDRDSHIVLYGCTKTTEQYVALLKNYRSLMIVDRDPDKRESGFRDLAVRSPEEVFPDYDPQMIILITIFHYKDVCEYLYSCGYEIGRQVFIMNAPGNMINGSSASYAEEIRNRILKGAEVYRSLRKKVSVGRILLSPWAASGDIYLCALYLDDYIKRENLLDYAIVVSTPGAQKVAALLGYETVLLSEEDAFSLLDLARAIGFEKLNIHNINVNVRCQRVGMIKYDIDFNTFHQKLAFSTEVRATKPVKMFQRSSEDLFIKNHLIPGKTVLISPYSGTLGQIPMTVCTKLSEELTENGFSVCTNVATGEMSIPGTSGLLIPYDQVVDFVNRACYFVGMRSGLCDIISSSDARMVIVHREDLASYFSLQRMGIKTDNILELIREEETDDSMVEKIISFMLGAFS